MPRKIDLAFTTWDGLLVLAPIKNKHGRTEWICRCTCGTIFVRRTPDLRAGRTSCRGPAHKGLIYKQGYAYMFCPGHPRAHADNRVLEHIVVMEGILGRHLLPGENVHHRDGVKDNNEPKNLELWTVAQPPGQRAIDLVMHAFETLKRCIPLIGSDDDGS